MKFIKAKDIESTEYAEIDDKNVLEYIRQSERKADLIDYELFSNQFDTLTFRFQWHYKPKRVIGDFVLYSYDFILSCCVISKRVYKYLFEENPNMVSTLNVKKIKLKHQDSFADFDFECNEDYYLITPSRFIKDDEKNSIDGLFWYFEPHTFTFNNKLETHSHSKLCISDSFLKEFKKQKFEGIVFEKTEEPVVKEEVNIYYDSLENDYTKKITEWVKVLSTNKIYKSKCKYIYYTLIEENNGYLIGVGGYLNKYFDDETFSFYPNMCDLVNTNLKKPDWQGCLIIIQNLLKSIYSQLDNDFIKIKAYIGFPDSEIYQIN